MKRFNVNFKYGKELIVLAILVVFVVAVKLTFNPMECGSFDCYQVNMQECSRASYIYEEESASWKYEVMGMRGNKCSIDVTLLNAKEGTLNLRKYEGSSMNCLYDEGVLSYPERDLDKCSGELKENLQTLIIEKMYRYITRNLDQIREEFTGLEI
jgi:hypothetical protein